MNEVNNTPTPTVEAEITPTAPKAEVKKQPVILATKSMRGKKGSVGAPAKPIIGLTKSPMRGRFTKLDLFNANAQTISMLTIINRIDSMLESKELIKLDETRKEKGKPGKPADLFILAKYAEKKAKAHTPTVTVENAPVVDTAPAVEPMPEPTAPAPEPVHTEQVAEHVL